MISHFAEYWLWISSTWIVKFCFIDEPIEHLIVDEMQQNALKQLFFFSRYSSLEQIQSIIFVIHFSVFEIIEFVFRKLRLKKDVSYFLKHLDDEMKQIRLIIFGAIVTFMHIFLCGFYFYFQFHCVFSFHSSMRVAPCSTHSFTNIKPSIVHELYLVNCGWFFSFDVYIF